MILAILIVCAVIAAVATGLLLARANRLCKSGMYYLLGRNRVYLMISGAFTGGLIMQVILRAVQ